MGKCRSTLASNGSDSKWKVLEGSLGASSSVNGGGRASDGVGASEASDHDQMLCPLKAVLEGVGMFLT